MLLNKRFQPFLDGAPICAMARGVAENILDLLESRENRLTVHGDIGVIGGNGRSAALTCAPRLSFQKRCTLTFR